MYRAVIALTLVAACAANAAAADPPRARIITRRSAAADTANQYRELNSPSSNSRLLALDGPLSSGASSAVEPRLLPHVVLVQRQVVAPAATVSRELAQQPVWPYKTEVFLLGEGQGGSSTIYLDPDVDYENQGSLTLDQNHYINRAQRMANQLRPRPARIIWGGDRAPSAGDDQPDILPAFILQKPDGDLQFPPSQDMPSPLMVRSNTASR